MSIKDDLVVTPYTSNIEFLLAVRIRDIIYIGTGRTTKTSKCIIRKKGNDTILIQIEKIVFVLVDRKGQSKPHYQTQDALQRIN